MYLLGCSRGRETWKFIPGENSHVWIFSRLTPRTFFLSYGGSGPSLYLARLIVYKKVILPESISLSFSVSLPSFSPRKGRKDREISENFLPLYYSSLFSLHDRDDWSIFPRLFCSEYILISWVCYRFNMRLEKEIKFLIWEYILMKCISIITDSYQRILRIDNRWFL